MFIDSHAHIVGDKLEPNADKIVKNMKQNNLKYIVNIACDLDESKKCCEFIEKNQDVFGAIGFQPENCLQCNDESLRELENLAQNKKIIAIGEIGLDYCYGLDQKDEQKKCLVAQLELAHKIGKSVIFHMRDCESDFKQILLDNKNLLTNKILFHCFNASVDFLNFVLKNFKNSFFAFGGICTYKNSTMPLLIKNCPNDKILAETDSPYLTPMPLRGKCLNEPKYIKYVYDEIAEIKNMTILEVENMIEKNFENFIGAIDG